jgi:hypothetical protein
MNDLKKEIEKMIGDTTQAKENTWNKMKQPPTKNRMPLIIMLSSTGILCFLLFIMYSSKFDGFNSQQSPNDIDSKLMNGQQEGMEVPWKLYEEKKGLPIYIDAQDSAILIKDEASYSYYNDLFQFQVTGREVDFSTSNLLIITFSTNSCGLEAEQFVQKNGELQITLNLPVNLRSKNFIACDDLSVPNAQIYLINKTDVQYVKLIKEEEEISVPLNELEIQQNIYDFEMLYTNDVAKATLASINGHTSVEVSSSQTLQEIQQIILQATKEPGIVNMANNPNYRILFENPLEKSFTVFLWLPEEDGNAVISSSRNTHTIYTLPKEMALQLLTLSEMENPFK